MDGVREVRESRAKYLQSQTQSQSPLTTSFKGGRRRTQNPKAIDFITSKKTYFAGTDVGAVRVDLRVVVEERGHRDARRCFNALAGVARLDCRRSCAVLACLAEAKYLCISARVRDGLVGGGDDPNTYLTDEEIRAVGVDDRVHKVQLVAFRAESENSPGDKDVSGLQGDVLIGTNGVTVITRDDRVRTITRA